MTPHALVITALLLGAFVFLAGLYGLLYCMAMLSGRPRLKSAGFFCYALHFGVMLVIVIGTPLGGWWKALIVGSCFAYLAIPPLTWRYLVKLHRDEEDTRGRKPAEHAARTLVGIRRGA